jgi:four helix bundle protein
MIREFSDLEVWQRGKELVREIYERTKEFPRQETYGLTDQLRRAAVSICANIAEGFERYYPKDKIRFYYHARGSLSECKSHILIGKDLGYLTSDTANKLIDKCNLIGKMLNAMISSLSRHIPS